MSLSSSLALTDVPTMPNEMVSLHSRFISASRTRPLPGPSLLCNRLLSSIRGEPRSVASTMAGQYERLQTECQSTESNARATGKDTP